MSATKGPTFLAVCKKHGETEFRLDRKGWRRCRKCQYEAVVTHQRKNKATLVAEHGGRCVVCGYDRCQQALEFHHVDPSLKSFSISKNSRVAGIQRLREEAAKCVLVCGNCHKEIECGVIKCPSLGAVYSVNATNLISS